MSEKAPPVEIPPEAVSPDALESILESFVLREGTDYGAREVTFESKVESLRRQLAAGELKLVYDPDSESVTLLTAQEWRRLRSPLE